MPELLVQRPRTEVELAALQIRGIDAWNRARRQAEQAADASNASREARMDLARQREVLAAQHRAIVARAERCLRDSVHLLARRSTSRAVVVHRNEWFTTKVSQELHHHGVEVLEALSNGAEGVGVVVAEQPDLLIVEDSLPMLPGEEVVREARRFSPSTFVVAQVDYSDRVPALLEAGAMRAYTRRVPPLDVAREVVQEMRGELVSA